ncbi:MAG: hypothetical protein JRN73_02285 [Nitrososphaerota archaeon]|nr:hypothetical protein [Nitrososphaerota archaeon]
MLPTDPNGFGLGYLVYLAAVFIPGVGFGELLGAWKKGDGLGEKLGYAFGLGLAVDTLVLVVRMSGATIAGYRLSGLGLETVYFLIAAGILALATSVAARKTVALPSRPSRAEAVLLVVILIQAGLVYLFFLKYPVFPTYPSQDFRNHAEEAQALISGNLTMLPGGLLYYAAQGQIALSLLSVGGFALLTSEVTMAIIAVLSPLIVYLAASKMFADKTASLLITAIYSLTGTVWYVTVFDAGLYPNFFGILASLFMLVAYVDVVRRERGALKWAVFLLAMVLFYMAHYSDVALLVVFLLIPVYQYVKDRSDVRRYLLPSAILIAPAAAAALLLPGLYPYIIALVENGRGNFISHSTLSTLLSGVPVLSYMAGEVNDDIEFIILMALTAVYVVRMKGGSALALFPLAWFLILVSVPANSNSWRFAFEGVTPLIFMAGYSIRSLTVEKRNPGTKKIRTNISKGWKVAIILIVLLTPIIVGSWTTEVVSDTTTNTRVVSQGEYALYNAMIWMSQSTPANSTFLSLTDWRFSYLNGTIGRTTMPLFFYQPGPAIAYARSHGADYIIVTYVVTVPVPSGTNAYPWFNFKPSANLTMAYSNDYVKIFKIV